MPRPTTHSTSDRPVSGPSASRRGLGYTPAQQRVIELLGRHGDGGAIGADVVQSVREQLDEHLGPIADRMPSGTTMWIGKTQLSQLDSCEGRWQAEATHPFRWSVEAARGTVAHKAVELQLNWRGEGDPGRLVDEAVARLADGETSLASFLRTLSTVELAELRQDAVGFLTQFEECFPKLKTRWRPVIDGRSTAPLAAGRITLSGRPDLTLGRAADGGKVIIDLKTGAPRRHHADDLRFYALVDACKVGVPARRVATMYLDSGVPVAASVSADGLRAAAERVIRSAEAMVEIRTSSRPASLRASPACTWCPVLDQCHTGQSWLARNQAGEHAESFWWRRPATPVP